MSARLQDKVGLVTGASRGIGKAIALALARDGAMIALAARQAGPVEEVAEEIRDGGGRALAISLDVSDFAEVKRAAETISAELGKVSILVNNAGITRDQLVLRMKPEDWDQVLRVNLGGTFNCTKVFGKDMLRAHWGRVINISSVVALAGNPGQSNYAASKAGLVGFTRSVARELAGRRITVNVVAPGFIKTSMTAKMSETAKEEMRQSIPLGRLGTPEDVARTVSFLAGDEAAYITGKVIHVDGGMLMT